MQRENDKVDYAMMIVAALVIAFAIVAVHKIDQLKAGYGKPVDLAEIEVGSVLKDAPEKDSAGKFPTILLDEKGVYHSLLLDEKPPQNGVVVEKDGKRRIAPITQNTDEAEKE